MYDIPMSLFRSSRFRSDKFRLDGCLLNKYISTKPSLTGELSKDEEVYGEKSF